MKKQYGKLVRDKIPQIIAADGRKAACTVLTGEAYRQAVRQKLREELAEYLESGALEELADLLEAMEAACVADGYTWAELLAAKREKRQARGAFEQGIFLLSVETPE